MTLRETDISSEVSEASSLSRTGIGERRVDQRVEKGGGREKGSRGALMIENTVWVDSLERKKT